MYRLTSKICLDKVNLIHLYSVVSAVTEVAAAIAVAWIQIVIAVKAKKSLAAILYQVF